MSNNSTSLVPASGGFSQQGSLDWVALGNMQYSASIAVLGRLSKAGIDTLTVAFGQAMCTKLPIGPHGEKVLNEAMRGLGAKSIAGDLIWFGVGIRHILRDLVQTSQGCSLIALCGALAEGYRHPYVALVLYEMAKVCTHQAELTPSFAQWEALVHVAAPTFVGTTLGNRIQQMSRFAPQSNERIENPHPSDLIKIIFDIAKVNSGELRSIYVQGNTSCSWIAVWSDFILGLRVLVRNEHGHTVYANFNPEKDYAQVKLGFVTTQGGSDIIHAGSSHLMRSGRDFISEFLDEDMTYNIDTYFFSCGRVSWESMFTERFGDQFSVLITNPQDINSEGTPPEPRSDTDTESWDGNFLYDNFVQSLAILAVIFVASSVGTLRNSPEAFVNRACKACPELKVCKEDWLDHVNSIARRFNCTRKELWDLNLDEISTLTNIFCDHLENIAEYCGCDRHAEDSGDNFSGHSSTKKTDWIWCIQIVTVFVMQMLLHLDRVILQSPLTPSMDGLTILYNRWGYQSILSLLDFDPKKRPIYPAPYDLLSSVMVLFSHTAKIPNVNSGLEQICCSSGDIYAYMHTMEELTDEWELARMVHVGVGHVQFNSRIHSEIHDYMPNPGSFPQYRAQGKQTVGNIDCLACDSTSEKINAKALIKDKARGLFYCHQIDSSSGTIQIPPLSFLRQLHRTLKYGMSKRRSEINSIEWILFLKNQKYVRVDGEGLVGIADGCSFLRPHKGNTLGRCVAISFQEGPTVLVKTDEALEIFARDWASYGGGRGRYYTLIS